MNTHKHIITSLKRVAAFSLLLISSFIQAQDNPWDSKPVGSNPWASKSTSSPTRNEVATNKEKQVEPEENKAKEPIVITAGSDAEGALSDPQTDRYYAAKNSTANKRIFYLNRNIVELNASSPTYRKSLRLLGKEMHAANGALGGGIASGAVINILALPFNLVASVIPTTGVKYKIEKFKEENPHATKKEIKVIKSGITGNRLSKATAGVGVGSVINLLAITALATL